MYRGANMTKSELFTQYNKARAAAKHGKLDVARVNRALGIAQSKNRENKYQTTIKSCTCKDHELHPAVACKHMVAKMIEVKVERMHAVEQPKVEPVEDEPKVIYAEYEWDGADPWNIVDEPWHAENCKYSVGKGLFNIKPQDLAEMLVEYKYIKADFISRNTHGRTNNFKVWWERNS